MENQLPLSLRLADLGRRVEACEAIMGPAGVIGSDSAKGPVCDNVAELGKKVDSVFQADSQLAAYERGVQAMDSWLSKEHVTRSQVMLHASVKRNYVLQHGDQLRTMMGSLEELGSLEEFKSPSCLQDVPKNAERLRKIEARGAVSLGASMNLHSHVSKLAEDFHKTIMALNKQMIEWDGLLSDYE